MFRLIPRSKEAVKSDLLGLKKVRINGVTFTIKKLNPLLDFPPDRMPQFFSYYLKRKPVKEPEALSVEQLRKGLDEMKLVVETGIVAMKPEGFAINDLFRWGDTGSRLYLEILAHSLNHFRGLKGVFFSIRIKRLLFTSWQKLMDENQSKSSSPTAVTA